MGSFAIPAAFPAVMTPPSPLSFVPSLATPLPSPSYPQLSGIVTPDNVPVWVPREVRFESIRGVLTPVEHFHGADIGMEGRRGWNPIHGYDTGCLPLSTGYGGWNPLHGFDNGPPPPFSVPDGSLAASIFGAETSQSPAPAMDAGQTTTAAPETSGAPAESASAEENKSDASGNGQEASASENIVLQRRGSFIEASSASSSPLDSEKVVDPLKSALKKGKEGDSLAEPTTAEDDAEIHSRPNQPKRHKVVGIADVNKE